MEIRRQYLPLIPAIFSFIAWILTFVLLFAGKGPGVLDEYPILTLNTSRIGDNLIANLQSSTKPQDPLASLINNLTQPLTSTAQPAINNATDSLTSKLGIQDFYAFYVLDYCEGKYVPSPTAPNAKMKITKCSSRKEFYHFDPEKALQKSLDESGLPVSLDQLDLGEEIKEGFNLIKFAFTAILVLFVLTILSTFGTLVVSGIWCTNWGDDRRSIIIAETVLSSLAFGLLFLASLVGSIMSIKGSSVLNSLGKSISLSADKGSRVLGVAWTATVFMLFVVLMASGAWLEKRRRSKKIFEIYPYRGDKGNDTFWTGSAYGDRVGIVGNDVLAMEFRDDQRWRKNERQRQ
ncbi:hypothetical protein E2P81_ATG09948 [Venturia nashicola]|uniref:Sur7 protein n=1 Tax=Venturia nashicola TaxID=86259 RepID=A0A4Z1NQN0_9PEZI|nr:hypothetical protein E6O75_ATG10167 [Venturia nashicola]TLD15100.1 hypothetical protein E2P81_ATG09948 [Venturia nashicola]